jgi:hypothetical protein
MALVEEATASLELRWLALTDVMATRFTFWVAKALRGAAKDYIRLSSASATFARFCKHVEDGAKRYPRETTLQQLVNRRAQGVSRPRSEQSKRTLPTD